MVETTSELSAHLTSGAIIVYALQMVKESKYFPWLDGEMKKTFRVLSAIAAFGASIGIAWNWDAAHGALTITGLSWSVILPAAKEWITQWVSQQVLYDTVVGKNTPAPKEGIQ